MEKKTQITGGNQIPKSPKYKEGGKEGRKEGRKKSGTKRTYKVRPKVSVITVIINLIN